MRSPGFISDNLRAGHVGLIVYCLSLLPGCGLLTGNHVDRPALSHQTSDSCRGNDCRSMQIVAGTPIFGSAIHKRLMSVTIISEQDFTRLMTAERIGSPPIPRQIKAIEFAAAANGRAAVGIAGSVKRRAHIEGDLFLVTRDVAPKEDGIVQSQDYFISAVSLSGNVSWAAIEPVLLLTSSAELQPTTAEQQGCAPLDLHSSLPAGIILNLESSRRPQNASARTVELHLFNDPKSSRSDRYVCSGNVHIAQTDSYPTPISSLPPFKSTIDLPDNVPVISEGEFYRLLERQQMLHSSKESKHIAARIVTAAREPSALGIQAQLSDSKDISTSLVVVARDLRLKGTTLFATEFYLAPIDFSGRPTWFGERGVLGFDGNRPTFNLDTSLCALLATPQREMNCDAGMCIDAPHIWLGASRRIGGGLPSGRLSPTLRLFESVAGRLGVNAIVCTQFLTPPELEARECGKLGGGLAQEVCNGRDDDCNGLIDEGGICDQLPRACPALPRTCGAISCGDPPVDLPDGLGGVVHCGGPCP